MPELRAVDSSTFRHRVLEASGIQPVLVDFWAAWCGPCRSLAPVLEQAAAEFAGRLTIVKVDTDAEHALAAQYAIRSIPAVKLFRHGKVVAEFVGAQPLQAIRSFVAPHLPKDSDGLLTDARRLRTSGRAAAALATLSALRTSDDEAVRIEIAACLALTGDPDGAAALLDALPPIAQAGPGVKEARALSRFARILASPDETDAIQSARVMAAREACGGRTDAALESLFAAAGRNRRYAINEGRNDLLAAFDLLPQDDPRLGAARRRLAALLH